MGSLNPLKPRILIVEDARDVANPLERGLEEEGFNVEWASNGEAALRLLRSEEWDLVILDLMLPDVSGESILEFISQKLDHPPVLVLTARSQLEDKLLLFKQGCDDYVIKPFAFEELLGRVRALLRRSRGPLPKVLEYEGLLLDPTAFRLKCGEETVSLTPKEFAICRALLREPGRLVSRNELLQTVWGLTHEPRTNFIEVHLANLRKKLSGVGKDGWVQTVRSSGFLFSRPMQHGS